MRDRGVKKAPFIVLIGANMPSILAEISFVSNPADERKLQTPEYRQKIAEVALQGSRPLHQRTQRREGRQQRQCAGEGQQ